MIGDTTPLTLDLEKSLYRAYREGWGDGATFMGMTRPDDPRHAQEYDSGYADGYQCRKNALAARARNLSYDPLVRLADHEAKR